MQHREAYKVRYSAKKKHTVIDLAQYQDAAGVVIASTVSKKIKN